MSFVDFCVNNRALETFLGPHFGPEHLILLRATCRALRRLIEAPPGRTIDIFAKSGFYWLILHYYKDGRPPEELLYFKCSGRDHDTQKLLIGSRASGMEFAIRADNLELVKWLVDGGCDTSGAVVHAAKFGRLEILKFLLPKFKSKDNQICYAAAAGGQLEVLKWARANGAPWNRWTCAWAAGGGHLEVLKWARANGAPWHVMVCNQAAQNGHLEVLKRAWANGVPWDKYVYLNANLYGHQEVVQWLWENGCQGWTSK